MDFPRSIFSLEDDNTSEEDGIEYEKEGRVVLSSYHNMKTTPLNMILSLFRSRKVLRNVSLA